MEYNKKYLPKVKNIYKNMLITTNRQFYGRYQFCYLNVPLFNYQYCNAFVYVF